jgi:hypothetical protein
MNSPVSLKHAATVRRYNPIVAEWRADAAATKNDVQKCISATV